MAELVASTVSGNSIAAGGHEGGGIYGEACIIFLDNITLAYNSATADPTNVGGGLSSWGVDWDIYNTIIANNRASQTGTNNAFFSSPVDDVVFDEYSIDSENTCRLIDPTSQVNTNPGLGPLQNNGGQTDTYAITSDSPAFDRGGSYFLLMDLDQRGVERPQGSSFDIGAYELVLTASQSINYAGGTAGETVTFSCNIGGIAHLTALPPTDCFANLAPGMYFPYGLFSFQIVGIPAGATVRLTITFPHALPENLQYWKCSGTCACINCTNLMTYNPGENYLVLTLTDGGFGDMDGMVNGRIIDPGGPAQYSGWKLTLLQSQSHSASMSPPQPPVKLPNLSVQSATLSATTVRPDEPVTVTATVANKGNSNGAIKLSLIINGEEEAVQGVSVNSGSTTPVTFSVLRSQPGIYRVYAGGVHAGDFKVSEYIDPAMILFISLILMGTAVVLGLVMVYRRQRAGY